MGIKLKRAYEVATKEDGMRVLVDRLWPRGVSKELLKIDYWMKDIAPSKELRKWFNHDPEKFDEFKQKYNVELRYNNQFKELKELVSKQKGNVTLVYAAKDEEHNQAIVLKEIIDNKN